MYDAQSLLDRIVYWLNKDDPGILNRAELRRLVEAWNSSGRNLVTMERLPELIPYLNPYHGLNALEGWVDFDDDGSGLRMFVFSRSPLIAAVRDGLPWPSGEQWAIDEARRTFIDLLLNPERQKLSEKPCARCGRYYVKKTARQKVYCSRKCGKDGTAAFATKQRLKAEHQRKLHVAAEAAKEWTSAHTKEDWRHWVSRRAEGRLAGLTPRFLTRAVNKGELTKPTKGER